MPKPTAKKKPRAGVVLLRDGKILLMYRVKKGKRYYCIPGGKVNKGEKIAAAAAREMREETSLRVHLLAKLYSFTQDGRREHYFLSAPCSGTPVMSGPELEKASPANQYHLKWRNFSALPKLKLNPPKMKKFLLRLLCQVAPSIKQ